jgi:hypothetical protein
MKLNKIFYYEFEHLLHGPVTVRLFFYIMPSYPLLQNTGCFKNNFTIVFEMLLCGECYEDVYT